MTKETFFLDDPRYSIPLPSTTPWRNVVDERKAKWKDISLEFFRTDAMLCRDCTRTNYECRHIVTWLAVHGFHHKLCKKKTFHRHNGDCVMESVIHITFNGAQKELRLYPIIVKPKTQILMQICVHFCLLLLQTRYLCSIMRKTLKGRKQRKMEGGQSGTS